MAKKSTPKKSTPKLPKKVAGVAVPKVLRRGTIADILNSPVGRLILAEALVAGAAAAAAALKNYKPIAEPVGQAVDAVERAGADAAITAKDLVQSAAGGLADVAAGVVRQIVPASSAAEDTGPGPADEKKGKRKQDKDNDGPSKH
jgi:hypothetical protein